MRKLVLFLILFLIFTATDIHASSITVDKNGNILIGQVLSKGSENSDDSSGSDSEKSDDSSGSGPSEDKSDDSSNSDSSGSNSSSSGSGRSDEERSTTTLDDGTTIQTRTKDGEVRTETNLPSGIKIKTREEEDKTRTDIYQGGTKLRLERKEGRTVIKLENEDGEETDVPVGREDEIFKIEERSDKNQVKVSIQDNDFVVTRANVAAKTTFPITVDLNTNELTITTPSGTKTVATLPDSAVSNMLAANIIDQVRGKTFTSEIQNIATTSSNPLEETIELITTKTGTLAYKIPGVSNQKLLGFIPVEIEKTATVSAETGELLNVEKPFVSKVLDFLSTSG